MQPTTGRFRILRQTGTCTASRRQRNLSSGMIPVVFVASLIATVWAESSGVAHRGFTTPLQRVNVVLPPPPPPLPPSRGTLHDETPTEESQKRRPPPPPPRPSRNIPATAIEPETKKNTIPPPPPPPRRFTNSLSSYDDRFLEAKKRLPSEEKGDASKESLVQASSSSTAFLPSSDDDSTEPSFDDDKEEDRSKNDHRMKMKAMSTQDNNKYWSETKEREPTESTISSRLTDQTEMKSAPVTSKVVDTVDDTHQSSTGTSDDPMSFRLQPQDDLHTNNQDFLPQGWQGEQSSSAVSQETFTQQAATEPRQQNSQSQTTGSPQYHDSFQRPAYQRTPSNQYHPPPKPQYRQSRNADSSAISSTLKSFWSKVEKGLDGLAKVEDSVTGRAQQLLSSVSNVASSSPSKSALSTDDKSTWNAREQLAKVSTPTKIPLIPYGNKYNVAIKKQKQQDSSKSKQMKTDSSSKGPVNWNDMATGKMIRANGGASSPNGLHPLPPSNPSFVAQHNPDPSSIATATAPQNQHVELQSKHPAARSDPYAANPYLQSSNFRAHPPREMAPVADTHSRSSRIPWDSSASSIPGRGSSSNQQQPLQPRSSVKPDYETDKTTLFSKILKAFPPLPKFSSPLNFFRRSSYQYASLEAWKDDDDDEDTKSGGFFGLFQRKSKGDLASRVTKRSPNRSGDSLAPPLKSLMMRCDDGKTTSLLLASDKASCRSIGKYQALFDGICVLLVLIGIQQIEGLANIDLPISLEELTINTLPQVASLLRDAVYTWAPVFAGYAYLALYMKRILLNSRVRNLSNHIGSTVEDESQYAQLFLRLAAAIRMDPSLPNELRQAAASQVGSLVSTTRLNSFVAMVLGSLIVMTVPVFGPFFTAVIASISQLVMLDEWRSWPIAWKLLVSNIRHIFTSLGLTLEGLMARGATTFLENPLQFAFHLSIFVSSLLITLVPSIEKRKKVNVEKDEDEDVAISLGESAQQFAKLGASSATRLTMLSENGSIENALEHWRNNRATMTDDSSYASVLPTIRRFAYTLLVAIIATLPIVVPYLVGMRWESGIDHVGVRWNSILDVSVVLVGIVVVARNAIRQIVDCTKHRTTVKSFLSLLSNTLEEVRETNRRQADIQFMASVSPTAGLVVKDLWAAHITKRAWAVRGANFQCKNGEILVVLGDDGAGKTRILTTIAESLIAPPRRSLTSNKVRGVVAIGGVESSKWDKAVLKRRLGVLLSDVRTVADAASLFSGWTMEEILEPIDGLRMPNSDRKLSSSGKASILLALKITGLYTTLIPKLPSKLSTVLTANEEDLRPSALRSRCQVLSPAEWSKLILAKVLAQTIYDNENAAASVDKVENCMVGSVLLLDDPTVQLSEVEEAKVLKDLRQTGAATVLATNKWATGRFADHVVVVSDGAIVESGTHNELISRGPQQSLYAAKWHAMTMQ